MDQVIAIDLGGTKVAMAVVSADAHFQSEMHERVILDKGPAGLVDQLVRMAGGLRIQFPNVRAIGLASAGPLDPETGRLLDPTNLHGVGERWGEVPLGSMLGRRMGLPVYLENDAAAAALAEAWKGGGVGVNNFVTMTLGTGLGVGVIANGDLVRSGRGLHPEVGHVYLRAGDRSAPCGCGNFGCAEAFLSGANFARRWAVKWEDSHLTGERLVEGARSGEKKYREVFHEYSLFFAYMVNALVVLYSPEKIFISGGFSEASDLFLPEAQRQLVELLSSRRKGIDLLPEISTARLGLATGLIGGAFIALRAQRVI